MSRPYWGGTSYEAGIVQTAERMTGEATVRLDEIVAADLDAFLDRVSELAFGPVNAYLAVDVQYTIIRTRRGGRDARGERGARCCRREFLR